MILTWGRIAIAPLFFLFFELADAHGAPLLVGVWAAFLLIEFSDLLDGHFARSRNQESDIGKVLDPFADALSRLTYFVALPEQESCPSGYCSSSFTGILRLPISE